LRQTDERHAPAQTGYSFIISEFLQAERVLASRHQAAAIPFVD
jgi:hypothetical protein